MIIINPIHTDFSNISPKKKNEIYLINLMTLFYLFRTTIPVFKYAFFFILIGIFVYTIISYRKILIKNIYYFIFNNSFLFFLGFFLIISFFLSDKLYIIIFKDIFNMLILMLVFLILTVSVKKIREIKFYFITQLYLLILFSIIVASISLLDLLDVYSYSQLSITNLQSGYEQLIIDNNFALLPVFYGLISILYLIRFQSKISILSILYFFLLIITVNILFSGSRRGIILFLIIIVLLVISKAQQLRTNNSFLSYISENCIPYLFSVLIITIAFVISILTTSYDSKTRILKNLGSRNIVLAKYKISYNLFRCYAAIDRNVTFSDFNDKIWSNTFIPEDPDSGWGSRFHQTIYPLEGKFSTMLPENAKGYLLDKSCNVSYYPSEDVSEAFSTLIQLKTQKKDHYRASIFCFVSDSFEINSANLCIPDPVVFGNTVKGKVNSAYDLSRKNEWQKLSIDFVSEGGDIPVMISCWKRGVKNFSSFKGYIIYAYPTYEKVDSMNIPVNHVEKISRNNKHGNLPHDVLTTSFNNKFVSLFFFPKLVSGQEIFQRLINIMNEDTTYYPLSRKITVNIGNDFFIHDRTSRWLFALQIYKDEYGIGKKLFGGGFNFLNWYGFYFLHDKTASDWPHNPFLSILLYSGIIGLLIYCFFLYKAFYYYIKYIKEYPLFFIFFLITFFFAFFSSGSPFDPPVFGFFSILPFFIHSVHKRDEQKKVNENKTA